MSAWRRFFALTGSDRRLVVQVAALLSFTRIALWVLPFSTVRGILDRFARSRRPRPAMPDLPAKVGWALAAVGRRAPAMTCLVQALAADALLRRHGFASRVHIGVRERRTNEQRPLDSHAWVECEGTVVVGKLDDLTDYAVLSR